MLKPVDGGPAVVACNTCRRPAAASVIGGGTGMGSGDGRRDGAVLVDALRAVQASDPIYAGIAVQEMPCLFACADACAVHLRAPDRIGYVLGRFEPTEAAARAILDYARAYAASRFGQVPFRDWPEGVKGHFITRMPPPGHVVE